MSYDVSIGDFSRNYTSNIRAMFYRHIPSGDGLRGLDGMSGRQAFQILASAWEGIDRERFDTLRDGVVGEPDFCAKYDAPNGWGSTIGAIMFLGSVMAACAQFPRHKLRVFA